MKRRVFRASSSNLLSSGTVSGSETSIPDKGSSWARSERTQDEDWIRQPPAAADEVVYIVASFDESGSYGGLALPRASTHNEVSPLMTRHEFIQSLLDIGPADETLSVLLDEFSESTEIVGRKVLPGRRNYQGEERWRACRTLEPRLEMFDEAVIFRAGTDLQSLLSDADSSIVEPPHDIVPQIAVVEEE